MDKHIIADLKDCYGIKSNQIISVKGGWLNKKWKVSTDNGELLVKQFSYERFNIHQLKSIEVALQRQIILEENGIPCPHIWQFKGNAIRFWDNKTAYMVMDFCFGKEENLDTITTIQMHSLGDVCGLMHKEFSYLPEQAVKGFPIKSEQILESLWLNFHTHMKEINASNLPKYQEAVLALEPILKQLTPDFFDKLPKGIAHEDFSPDNMLFDTDSVSAIVDFDRNCYSFIWHDIGRVILSLALEDNKLNLNKVQAFVDGYSKHFPLKLADIADALRISWCIETPWWIQVESFRDSKKKIVRFKDEILWLTKHWFELDNLLCTNQMN